MSNIKALSQAELAARTENRKFDQVCVAVPDLSSIRAKIEEIYELHYWTEGKTYGYDSVSTWMNDKELVLMKIDERDSVWKEYANKYSKGICCVREVVSADMWQKELDRYASMGLAMEEMPEDETGKTVILNTLGLWGGLLAIHLDSENRPAPEKVNEREMTQINITTDDVDRTCQQLVEVLQIGPFGIGTLCNKTVKDAFLLVDGKRVTPEYQFQLGIVTAGNIEFEVIQPVKGPTVYQSYIDARGVGYHHIKEVFAPEELEAKLQGYEDKGMPLCIKGTMSITTFAYINSQDDFTFYVEFGDGINPDALPDGYDLYLCPAE